MEVRNESGGLIVLSETDGTEYTFSMDNPDPCDLYSFTVTPLCGTVEGWSAKVNGTPFNGIAVCIGASITLHNTKSAISSSPCLLCNCTVFILIVTEQVTVMGFTLELMDSEAAMVTLTVLYSVSLEYIFVYDNIMCVLVPLACLHKQC